VSAIPLGLDSERWTMLVDLLEQVPDAPASIRYLSNMTLANLAIDRGDGENAVLFASSAHLAAVEAGDVERQAWANYFRIHGHWALGELDGAKRLVVEVTGQFATLANELGRAYMLWVGAMIADDLDSAAADVAESQRLFRLLGMPSGLAHASEARGLIALRLGEPDSAREHLITATEIVTAARNPGCASHILWAVAACAADLGWWEDAAELVGAAEMLRMQVGHGHRVWGLGRHHQILAALDDKDGGDLAEPRQRGYQHTLDSAGRLALDVLSRPASVG
jgi:hypothetical protein